MGCLVGLGQATRNVNSWNLKQRMIRMTRGRDDAYFQGAYENEAIRVYLWKQS